MKQYEQILDKISPAFYKLTQYRNFRTNHFYFLLGSYLSKANFPVITYVDIIGASKNISYFYEAALYDFEKPTKIILSKLVIIILTTRNNANIYKNSGLDEFIVNMIINKFIFKNERIVTYGVIEKYYRKIIYDNTYKDLFIALVGNDLYETIRTNIR